MKEDNDRESPQDDGNGSVGEIPYENPNTESVAAVHVESDNEEYVEKKIEDDQNSHSETEDQEEHDNEEYLEKKIEDDHNSHSETEDQVQRDNEEYVEKKIEDDQNSHLEIEDQEKHDNEEFVEKKIEDDQNSHLETEDQEERDNEEYVENKFEDDQNSQLETGDYDDFFLVTVDADEKLNNTDEVGIKEEFSNDELVSLNTPDIPRINILSNTDTTSSASDSSEEDNMKKKWKKKKRKLSEKLSEVNGRLAKELGRSAVMRTQLQEESDAKERLENNLSELQARFDKQLKEEEELRFQLHQKDELCLSLQAKDAEVVGELEGLKESLMEMNGRRGTTDGKKLNSRIFELKNKLTSNDDIITTKDEHIDILNEEIALLNDEMNESAGDEVHIAIEDGEDNTAEESMDNNNEFQLQSRIKELENEVADLNSQLDQNKDKYNATLAEALSTLKEVQDAYGEMRDVVLEGFKQENAILKDQLRIAEEKGDEEMITGMRQEILDLRLQLERSKQAHKDEVGKQEKQISGMESKQNSMMRELEMLKNKVEEEQKENLNIRSALKENENLADERKTRITELDATIISLNISIEMLEKNVSEKDGLILELKNQLLKEAEVLTKEHTENETLKMEVEMMESVKRQNQRLEEDIEEMNHKVKLRGTKIKFLKKHIKELEEQKQKADSIMSVIPEMQKQIDELMNNNDNLKQQIIDKQREDEEQQRRREEKKKEEEERLVKEKEEWEKSILGMGKCLESHDEEEGKGCEHFNRPNSAPLIKPRPPTAKRIASQNHTKGNVFRAPTLNPLFLQSYPEGRRASKKMKQHQEKIILSNSSKINLFRSVTKPMDYASSYRHMASEKYFPKISPKNNGEHPNNYAPRVLVWGSGGNGPGNRMVAVGDHVLVNLHSQCSLHGENSNQQAGIVKFIGFVDGNDDDVYIGLRLEENLGYTDGTIQGKRYFRSELEKGAFVHLNDVVKVLQTQTKHAPTLAF